MPIQANNFFISIVILIKNEVLMKISLQKRDNQDPVVGGHPY